MEWVFNEKDIMWKVLSNLKEQQKGQQGHTTHASIEEFKRYLSKGIIKEYLAEEQEEGTLNCRKKRDVLFGRLLAQAPDFLQPYSSNDRKQLFSSMASDLEVIILKVVQQPSLPLTDNELRRQKEICTLIIDQLCDRGYAADLFAIDNFQSSLIYQCLFSQSMELKYNSVNKIASALLMEVQGREITLRKNSQHISNSLVELFGKKNFTDSIGMEGFIFDTIKNQKASPILIDALCITSLQFPSNNPSHTKQLFSKFVSIWTGPSFVLGGSLVYQEVIAIALISCCRILKASTREKDGTLDGFAYEIQKFLSAIPSFLNSPDSNVMKLGMVVAEIFCSKFTPAVKLTFPVYEVGTDYGWLDDLSINPLVADQKYISRYSPIPSSHSFSLNNKADSLSSKKVSSNPLPIKTNVGHPLFTARLKTDLKPNSINQCLHLISTNQANDVLLGIENLEPLILRASDTEVSEHAAAVCSTLVSLQDDYNLDGFEQFLSKSLIAITIRQGEECGNLLISDLFVNEISIVSKLRCLRVLTAIPLILQDVDSIESENLQDMLRTGSGSFDGFNNNKSTIHFATLFATGILNCLSHFSNWEYMFEQDFSSRVAQKLLNSLSIFVLFSDSLVSYQKFSTLIISIRYAKERGLLQKQLFQSIKLLMKRHEDLDESIVAALINFADELENNT